MRYFILLFVVLAAVGMSFAQAPNPQGSQGQNQVDKGTTGTIPVVGSPSTFSDAGNLSGCLVDGGGRFWLSESGDGSVYSLQASDLNSHVNHVVRLNGYPLARRDESGNPGFHVNNIVDTGELCSPLAAEQLPAIAITGKAGNEGDIIPETTTHVNQNTAGPDTQAGVLQKRGHSGITNHTPSVYDLPGHPPNWEQVGESRGAATDLAASAEQTEVGAPEGTFGVGSTRPNYQSPSSSQEIGGAPAPIQHSANTNGSTQVSSNLTGHTLEGCIAQSSGQWQLTSATGHYRLAGNTADLSGKSGHTVALSGRLANANTFQVSAVRDLSPSCRGAQ